MMAKVKVYTYTVFGIGGFPTDMLRYDSCYPDNESDSVQMSDYGKTYAQLSTIRTIRMRSHYPPTIGRWNSFGWKVDNIQERSY